MKKIMLCLSLPLVSMPAFASTSTPVEAGKFACYSPALADTLYLDSRPSDNVIHATLGRFHGSFNVIASESSTTLLSPQGERVFANLKIAADGTFSSPVLTLSTQFQKQQVVLECDVQD